MPLTWVQYEALGITGLIQRLLARCEHSLAWKITGFLGLTPLQEGIWLHWSQMCINDAPAGLSDAALISRLTHNRNAVVAAPCVVELAKDAYRAGRQHLSIHLLQEQESNSMQQVCC